MTQTLAIRTIGHGNHVQSAFLDLLRKHGVQMLIDVRTRPYSRRNPQFNREALESTLSENDMTYVWKGAELGGFRKAAPYSPHTGLDVEGFRGYADHMASDAFRAAAGKVIDIARATPLALMCAEIDPFRCHRQFIADHLMVLGMRVIHIRGDGSDEVHRLHPCLRVMARKLIYDRGSQQRLF